MTTGSLLRLTLPLALVLSVGIGVAAGGAKVRAQVDKTFDFRGMRTWAWHPSGAGEVRMAVTADDNPEAVKARFEPVITDAVQQELAKRQFSQAQADASPQLYVHYYVLISTNMSAQTIGQFAPAVPEWGLPPFSGATQSLRVFQKGSLLIDVTSAASGNIVWRGLVDGEIREDRKPQERNARLRSAIADLLKKLPKAS